MLLSVIHVFRLKLRHLGHMFNHVTKDSVSKIRLEHRLKKETRPAQIYPIKLLNKKCLHTCYYVFLPAKITQKNNKKYLANLPGIFILNAI